MLHLLCPNPALDRTLLTKNYKEGAANRPFEVKDYPGGKSFNVAYAIQKTYPKAKFKIHTLLGGYFGKYVHELAMQRNISLINTNSASNTRICSIIADVNTNLIYPLYEKGNVISQEVVDEYTANLLDDIKDGDLLVLSGSFLPGFPKDYVKILGEKLKDKDIALCVDTSGSPLKYAHKLKPKLIKINDEELLDIFPNFDGKTIGDYLHFFKKEWNQLSEFFIVTLGKNGVVAKMDNKLYHLKSEDIQAKNPIASGDFFFGVLIGLLENNKSFKNALIGAISASTANCLNWYPEFTDEQFQKIKSSYITVTEH